jgi:hypothetical protein
MFMFEDFRKQAEEADFPNENDEESQPGKAPRNWEGRILGLTPLQRFIVAFMLMLMTVILSLLLLIVTSKIIVPF